MTNRRFAALCLALSLALCVVLPAGGGSAGAATTVKVAFLKGEQMTTVDRPGSSVARSVRALLSGPTPRESRQGITTQIPPRTRLLGAKLARGVATVDIDATILTSPDRAGTAAVVAQLVLTVTAVPGVKAVRLLVNGRPTSRLTGRRPAGRSPRRTCASPTSHLRGSRRRRGSARLTTRHWIFSSGSASSATSTRRRSTAAQASRPGSPSSPFRNGKAWHATGSPGR